MFDELEQLPQKAKDAGTFSKKSLFIMSSDYKLAELQRYLETQHNIHTLLVNKKLNYDDKIFICIDDDTK